MSESQGVDAGDVEMGINEGPPPAYGASGTSPVRETADPAPPPSYEDAAKDDPPSYNSIYGQMQDAKRDSSSALDYVKKIVNLVVGTVCVTGFILAMCTIPLAMIVIGAVFFNDCTIDLKIPIFLIVFGGVFIAKNLQDLRNRYQYGERGDTRAPPEHQQLCSKIIGCALVGFFIAGNVWIYKIYPIVETKASQKESDLYCNPVLYYFAFSLVTVVYVACGLICCCVCCTAGAAAATTNEDDD